MCTMCTGKRRTLGTFSIGLHLIFMFCFETGSLSEPAVQMLWDWSPSSALELQAHAPSPGLFMWVLETYALTFMWKHLPD